MDQGKQIIPMMEPDKNKGGLTVEQAGLQCLEPSPNLP